MANQTVPWAEDYGAAPATTEQAIADEMEKIQHQMSPREVEIFYAYYDVHKLLQIALNVLAVISNSLILMVSSFRRPLSVPQVYIAAIATCDLSIGIFAGIAEIFNWTKCVPQSVRVLCVYLYWPSFGITVGCAMSAALSAMYLSVDRLISLKFPLQYHAMSSPRKAKVLVIATIIFTQIVCINYPLRLQIIPEIVPTTTVTVVSHSRYTTIGLNPTLQKVCFALEFFLRFATPLIVMLISNTWTLYCIAINNRRRKNLAPNSEKQPQKTKYLAVTVGVVIIFFITQSVRTGFLFDTLIFHTKHRGLLSNQIADFFGQLLANVNSVVNIFVYLAFDKQFRKILITRVARCSKLEPTTPNNQSNSQAATMNTTCT